MLLSPLFDIGLICFPPSLDGARLEDMIFLKKYKLGIESENLFEDRRANTDDDPGCVYFKQMCKRGNFNILTMIKACHLSWEGGTVS